MNIFKEIRQEIRQQPEKLFEMIRVDIIQSAGEYLVEWGTTLRFFLFITVLIFPVAVVNSSAVSKVYIISNLIGGFET